MSRSTVIQPSLLPLMQQLDATVGCRRKYTAATPSMAAPPAPASPPPSQPSFLDNLPIRSDGRGLSSFDRDTLERTLKPVAEALRAMDAEAVLDLKRTNQGATLRDGVFVKPIHGEINPPQTKYERDGSSIVRYLHLSEVEGKYSIGIFVFPPYATIPLHDHPGMCVLSRVLYGDLHRLSLDLVKEQPQERKGSWFSNMVSPLRQRQQQLPEGSKRALKNGVDYLQAPDVTVLYPYDGNLHEFVAGASGAAVLDVLLPPYDIDQNRDCTFYTISDDDKDDTIEDDTIEDIYPKKDKKNRACWIIPTNQPEDFHCLSGTYRNVGCFDESDNSDHV